MKLIKLEKISSRLFVAAIFLYCLSIPALFSPLLTPRSKLGLSKGITAADLLADISFFIFFIGLSFQIFSIFVKMKNHRIKNQKQNR